MAWLVFVIFSYFLLAIASVGDRFFLTGPLKNPKVYTFYVGAASLLAAPFIFPFVGVRPDFFTLLLGLAAGLFWVGALWAYFLAIAKSEVSRVVPATGAFISILTLLGAYFTSREMLLPGEIFAFALLLIGGVLIVAPQISMSYFFHEHTLPFIVFAAFLFTLVLFLVKAIFLRTPFAEGLLLILIGRGLASLFFLIFSDVKKAVFAERVGLAKQVAFLFICFQSAGGLGSALQIFSISLAKISQLSLINALEGTRYLFLFIFVWLAARWRPELLKEEMAGAVLRQKLIAGVIIISGIAILVLA